MEYLPRSLYTELDELLPHLPAIAIDEPKGVGKTATAARRADLTLGLDSPSTRAILESDFALSSYQNKKLLLDEWQHLPQIWDMVRRKVDADSPPGTFILTGSATPYDMRSSHSGVGRVVSLRMRPMGLHERGITAPQIRLSDLLAGEADISAQPSDFSLADYMDAIVNSGFPGFSALPPPKSTAPAT